MTSTRCCPECRQPWNASLDFASIFKVVPSDLFEREDGNTAFVDSTKTKMVVNVLKRCLTATPLETNPVFQVQQDGSNVPLSEINSMPHELNKVVIFSQFNKMLDILEESFKKNKVDVCWTRIDGRFNKDKRQERLKQFKNEEKCQVLLAT